MATLTYAGPAEAVNKSWDALLKTGALRKRELPPTRLQSEMRESLAGLWRHWDDAQAKRIAAVNLLLDAPSAERQAEIQKLKDEVGACGDPGPSCPRTGCAASSISSASAGPSASSSRWRRRQPPAVQHLAFQKLAAKDARMGAPTGAPAGVTCAVQ
jgi:hypothetical protein